jgi:hypothetical protein
MIRSFISVVFILLLVQSRSRVKDLITHFSVLRVVQQTGGTKVEWRNQVEFDVRLYSIERSVNGTEYTSVGVTNPISNNGGITEYTFIDVGAPSGPSFYRICARDLNGETEFSQIVNINITDTRGSPSLVINTADNGILYYRASGILRGRVTLNIIDVTDAAIYSFGMTHSGGAFSEWLDLGQLLHSGDYKIEMRNGERRVAREFTVR